ncbi:MAG: hypothetical protein M1547_03140 [Gammaproteobacteria bacterium]|nr:hypothetical protein [Gammaproteobacteria bacterium]
MNSEQQPLPLALQIGASTFHPGHDQAKLDALLAELSPYQTPNDILKMFRACLPDGRSCAPEAVLWVCRCAVVGADIPAAAREELLDFINQLANEIDGLHEGAQP